MLAILGGALVVYASQRYGLALQSDSVGYLQLARAIHAGRGVPPAYTLQPPLYPALLAFVAAIASADPLALAVAMHALLFACILFLSGATLLALLPNAPALAVLGALAILFGRPLVLVALTAYSELLFIFLELITLIALSAYLSTSHRKWLIVTMTASALACLTRYVGVALIGTGVLSILFFSKVSIKSRALYTITFAVGSGIPLALWALRNLLVSDEPFGPRAASAITFPENIVLTAGTFATWFVPDDLAWLVYLAISALVIITLIPLLASRFSFLAISSPSLFRAFLLFRGFRAPIPPSPFRSPPRAWSRGRPSIAPFALFSLVFVVLMIGSATFTAYNRIGSRLLSPLFIPALMLALVVLDRALNALFARASFRHPSSVIRPSVIALALVAVTLIYPVVTDRQRVERSVTQGSGGYSTERWANNQTIRYVRAHRGELLPTVYSNGTDALYILTDVETLSILPQYRYASNEPANNATTLRGAYPPEPGTLVWLDDIERDSFLFSLEELEQFTQLTLIRQLRDGAIYRMEKQK